MGFRPMGSYAAEQPAFMTTRTSSSPDPQTPNLRVALFESPMGVIVFRTRTGHGTLLFWRVFWEPPHVYSDALVGERQGAEGTLGEPWQPLAEYRFLGADWPKWSLSGRDVVGQDLTVTGLGMRS